MNRLLYALLSEGSSDRALFPLLEWLLRIHAPETPLQSVWVDPAIIRAASKSLNDRLPATWHHPEYRPCQILFVHRDADNDGLVARQQEIREAAATLTSPPHIVCTIPIRETEAWFIWHEIAIREAADNPRGKVSLDIPQPRVVEDIGQVKEKLNDLLRTASGLKGRRLKEFNAEARVHRVAQLIPDYAPLRGRTGFDALEAEIRQACQRLREYR